MAVRITRTLCPRSRASWRRWLEKHAGSVSEVWLLFYKKASGKRGIRYDEAVEEAICYGWIDSIVKRYNDEQYAQKFTPRKPASLWSELNLQRARAMIRAGLMTAAGLDALGEALKTGSARRETPRIRNVAEMPPGLTRELARNGKAQANFETLPSGYKSMCLRWILEAKREDTRQRRVAEFVELTAQGKRLGMK